MTRLERLLRQTCFPLFSESQKNQFLHNQSHLFDPPILIIVLSPLRPLTTNDIAPRNPITIPQRLKSLNTFHNSLPSQSILTTLKLHQRRRSNPQQLLHLCRKMSEEMSRCWRGREGSEEGDGAGLSEGRRCRGGGGREGYAGGKGVETCWGEWVECSLGVEMYRSTGREEILEDWRGGCLDRIRVWKT